MARLAMDDPFFFAKALRWYKRADVQAAIVAACEDREVAPRYGEGFGKRPDVLHYPADVLEFAKKKATSFHCSEERWKNVQQVRTGASRKEQDDLRAGWDLVLDVDCPYWYFAKLTAHLFVKALRDHGVRSVTAKFSGSKGFHVGVPFEAFPARVLDQATKDLFPEAPRALASYLLDYISDELIKVRENTIVLDRAYKITYEKLKEVTGKDSSELIAEVCRRCRARRESSEGVTVFLCGSCGHAARTAEYHDYLVCERCNGVMEPQPAEDSSVCARCSSSEFEPRFNVQALIEVDTVLLASRHLFRTPYSLHEKSGLVSAVIPVDAIMGYEKEMAAPERIASFPPFLDASAAAAGEGAELLIKALERAEAQQPAERREFAVPEEAIPEELFPPCMQSILKGLVDGKKRAMFALTNFLRTCGWGFDQIEARLFAWNEANPESLREVVVKGHMRQVRMKKEVIPPANCKSFYQDIRVCRPDGLCKYIKNPSQYAKRRAASGAKEAPAGRQKLTEEQKAMRKAYREKRAQERKGQG